MALTRVGKGSLDKGVIKNQDNLGAAAADTDEYLLYDASSDSLKAIAASNVTPNETLITGKTALTAADLASVDLLLIYDDSSGTLKKIAKSDLVASVPAFTSITPSNALSGDGTGNYSFAIDGTGFESATVSFIGNDATVYTADTTTTNSATSITAVIAKSSLPPANEPFDIKITNSNSLTSTSTDALTIDAQPAWVTASGSLATIFDGARTSWSGVYVQATDPESGAISYSLESGSLPSGTSLNTSTGLISGTPNAVGSDTTSSFTIRASDTSSNIADRAFTITIKAPSITSFTSSGTFSVPSGVSTVNVLVVAGGGGSSGQHAGGAGAGGLIYRPGFPVTPGGSVSVTVGDGGTTQPNPGMNNAPNGQDSVFSTLTAKGGGGAGGWNGSNGGSPGGSGGGGTHGNGGGSAIQPNQGGDSGTYGFGNGGGTGPFGGGGGGGAGGAGAAGQSSNGPAGDGGAGGIGRAYSISGTSVYYAGGGGGGGHSNNPNGGNGGDGGNGGGGNGGHFRLPATQPGQAGTANRGGGGGGGGAPSPVTGSGGKGIVIVAY